MQPKLLNITEGDLHQKAFATHMTLHYTKQTLLESNSQKLTQISCRYRTKLRVNEGGLDQTVIPVFHTINDNYIIVTQVLSFCVCVKKY